MSTRSLIVTKTDNDSYKGIYVHFDGYPEHNGKILQKHYTDQEKINALIDLGNASILAPSIEKPEGHSYNTPVEGHCIFYDRDRGEDGQEAFEKFSLKEVLNYDCGQDFVYIWDGSKWTVFWHDNGLNRRSLTDGEDLCEVLKPLPFEKQ